LNWHWTETSQLSYIRDLAFDRTGIFDWNEPPRESNSSTSYEVPSNLKKWIPTWLELPFLLQLRTIGKGRKASLEVYLFERQTKERFSVVYLPFFLSSTLTSPPHSPKYPRVLSFFVPDSDALSASTSDSSPPDSETDDSSPSSSH